ncbi:MAG: hypothetical protein IIA05_01080 [Proteobacteria bacterium]|nr:hypothetical protein [Pseudomonadota bacterium]
MLSKFRVMAVTIAIAVITLGLAAVPALADQPDPNTGCHGPHKGCNGGDRDETFYDVVIGPMSASGDFIAGESDDDHPWLTFGNGTSIGLGDATLSPPGPARPGIGEFTDLSFFHTLPGDSPPFPPFSTTQGKKCFPKDGDEEKDEDEKNHRDVGTFSIHQGRVQEGRGGRAQASFWFHGFTHTEVDEEIVTVLYALLLTGDTISLPPTGGESVVIAMTAWQLTATNKGQAVKSASCIGDGEVYVNVTVTEHDPDAEHGHDHD